MRRSLLYILCLFCCTHYLCGQTDGPTYGDLEYENRKLNDIYSLVDKTQITSGFFVNRGFYAPELPVITTINSLADVDQFYPSLRKAYVGSGTNPVKPYLAWLDSLDSFKAKSSKISLALFAVDMHGIKGSAWDAGTVYFDANQRLRVTNAATAYQVVQLCTTVPNSFEVTGNSFQFVMPSALVTSNNPQIRTEIDFADNIGYRPVAKDQVIAVYYGTGGTKTVKVRYLLGTTNLGESTFDLKVTSTVQARMEATSMFSVTVDKDRWHPELVFESWPNSNRLKYLSRKTGADVYEYMGCDNKRDKYCILVEGIDANNKITASNVFPAGSDFNTAPISNMFREMLANGYEVVYVDFHSGGDYIENNSLVLAKVINEINVRKGSRIPNIVVGVSMGGLVARHALRQMELAGNDHQTSLVNYFDSPHLGANVPVGYQTLTNALLTIPSIFDKMTWGFLPGPMKDVRETNHDLSCPASTQLLNRYLGTQPHPNFVAFQQQLANEGLPQKCRNYAVVCGSNNATGQGFNPSDNLYTKTTDVGLEFDVWASPNNGRGMVSRIKEKLKVQFRLITSGCFLPGLFGRRACWQTINVNFTLVEQDLYSYSGYFDKCYDNAPGSTFDGIKIGISSSLGGSFPVGNGYFCFIPSVSAAYLKAPYSSNLFHNLKNYQSNFEFTNDYSAVNAPHIFDSNPAVLASFVGYEVMPNWHYVQNSTFTNHVDLLASTSITMGFNVYPLHAAGNVTFYPNIWATVKAGSEVVIKPGTVISNGSNVRIYTDQTLLGWYNNCYATYRLEESVAQDSDSEAEVISGNHVSDWPNATLVFPNPIHAGTLYFGRTVTSYKLTNTTGTIVQEGTDASSLDVAGLAKGLYMIHLDNKTEKVIIY